MADDKVQETSTLARLYQISQVGTEMAVPAALGFVLDYYVLDTLPWFTVVGAILGPVLAFWHLLVIVRTLPEDEKRK